ncbi:MAG: type VI secretion system membrane subunit TssM, partial [Polyangiaceae bacterium]|nr:type VI secretion system membrane subunit TssM [Polyangiaceae bacterium]
MWLWIFGILIILAVWTIWLLFPPAEPGASEILPLWLAVTVTVVILGLLIGLWLVRRIRAARAARALENAIKQQAQEQAINAKPEDRPEIQALYQQIAEGINALKTSKLAGGRRGEQALYALPWNAIVGQPGAGKTTALRHSGLQFPFLDPSGGGVRGVGGTRNCDWRFTNEAIILDTAGRYTTETEDRDEWVAFLEQLMKYRPEKPLNGVIVAVSVSELLDATDDQIRSVAGKVRARIDEMQETLKMTVPVYVTFTKSDLVAGFVEYFGDLKKSERGQPWGATFRIDSPKTEPGKMFESEFDILVERLHNRVTKRINLERSRTGRERIYQFPLEFAAIKKPLADFMQEAFAPGAGSGPDPILRGFYFTSGTQEGKPLDRVVGAMGRAFGLKGSVVEEEPSKEAKSYFLKDVFEKIMFPDQELASLSQGEVRRRLLQRVAIAAAATFLALLFIVPGVISYMNNRDLVLDSERISNAAKSVNWADGTSSVQKVQKLDELRSQIEKLKDWRDNGKPISYSWFMYQGNTLLGSLIKQYNATLTEGFLKPTKAKLEEKVAAVQGKEYLKDYNNLKTYLLLGEPERLAKDVELERWHSARLTQTWAEVLLPQSELPEPDLKARIFPHVQLYVQLMRDGDIPPVERDAKLVETARERLRTADQATAYYELFVLPRNEEKIDETGPDSPDNLKFPPITLANTFADRPELTGKLGVLDSKKFLAEGRYGQVDGAFTTEAFKVIDKLLAEEGVKLLEREKWVVPYDRDEKKQGERVQTALKRARQRYENNYISQWEEFFRDIDVKIPNTNAESIKGFKLLSTPEWAYKRLLTTLSDNIPCPDPSKSKVPGSLTQDGGVVDQVKLRVQRRFEAQSNIRVEDLQAEKDITSQDRLCFHFKPMIVFGVDQPYVPPQAPADGPPPPPQLPPEPQLNKYIGHLERLASEMQVVEEGPPSTETKNATELFTKAVKESEEMLLRMDKTGQQLMTPLLMNPLRQGYQAFMKGAGGAASGLWEVMVWPDYREKIKDRYPFNVSARRDASYEDMVAFFQPKTGTLWGFYDQYLAN